MSSPLNVVGKDQFNKEVILSETPVLVDFWAPWCGPCQMMAPVLEELAKKYDGKLKVVKVDTEEMDNQNLAIEYQISSIPNMKLFKSGQVVKDFVGFRPVEQMSADLQGLI